MENRHRKGYLHETEKCSRSQGGNRQSDLVFMSRGAKGNWRQIFGNDHPVHIEIGMGKGKFIHGMAGRFSEINYIGIEKYSSVLFRAVQKMEEEPLGNLKFVRMDAEEIDQAFAEDEVDRIYLNFSDPWPKDRHAKRRLPSREFLARYARILKPDGCLEFKTDNRRCLNLRWKSCPCRLEA